MFCCKSVHPSLCRWLQLHPLHTILYPPQHGVWVPYELWSVNNANWDKEVLLINPLLPFFVGRFSISGWVNGRSSRAHFGKLFVDFVPVCSPINLAIHLALKNKPEKVEITDFRTDHECKLAQEWRCDLDTSLTLDEVICKCVEVKVFCSWFLHLKVFIGRCIDRHQSMYQNFQSNCLSVSMSLMYIFSLLSLAGSMLILAPSLHCFFKIFLTCVSENQLHRERNKLSKTGLMGRSLL